MKVTYILPAALLFLLGFVVVLYAQGRNQGLTLTPVSFEFTLRPGETVTKEIRFENTTGNSEEVRVDTRNFSAQGEQGGITLTTEDIPYSLAKWITLPVKTGTVGANAEQTFVFTVTVPKNAEPGGHFGSVVFATVPPSNLGKTGAVVSREIAALILVRVPGDVTEKASITGFSTDKSFYEFGPVKFQAKVKNESGVHIKPIGVITIKNELTGHQYYVGIDGKNVLPNAIRQIPATWDEKLLLGKYVAIANMSFGTKNMPLPQVGTEFYAFPVRIGAGVLLVLLILFFLRKRIFKAVRVMVSGK